MHVHRPGGPGRTPGAGRVRPHRVPASRPGVADVLLRAVRDPRRCGAARSRHAGRAPGRARQRPGYVACVPCRVGQRPEYAVCVPCHVKRRPEYAACAPCRLERRPEYATYAPGRVGQRPEYVVCVPCRVERRPEYAVRDLGHAGRCLEYAVCDRHVPAWRRLRGARVWRLRPDAGRVRFVPASRHARGAARAARRRRASWGQGPAACAIRPRTRARKAPPRQALRRPQACARRACPGCARVEGWAAFCGWCST